MTFEQTEKIVEYLVAIRKVGASRDMNKIVDALRRSSDPDDFRIAEKLRKIDDDLHGAMRALEKSWSKRVASRGKKPVA